MGLLARIRSRREAKLLEPVLTLANPKAPLVDRMEWLADLLSWVRGSVLTGGRPIVRVKFLLGRLERNEDERARVTATIAALIDEVRAVDLLASSGVPSRFDFVGEIILRAHRALLPTALVADDFAAVLSVLLPSEADAEWIEALDDATLARVRALLDDRSVALLDRNASDAVRVLAALSEAESLDGEVRERLGDASAVEPLSIEVGRATTERHDPTPAVQSLRAKVVTAIAALDEEGASIDLTYRLDHLLARLDRLLLLLPAVLHDQVFDPRKVLATIVREGIEERRLGGLFRRSTHLLARKVVDHSAEVGKHYIATGRAEYMHMLRAAMGGGVVMGVATVVKLKIAALHLPTIYDGIVAGLNYAAAFLVVQALGFSVATKQPASTAPALAASLAEDDAPRRFATEVARIIRSQVAAIFGNVLLVPPTAVALDLLHHLAFGTHAASHEKAEASVASLTLLGPTPIYAAFTGILLWLTAMLSGTVANWLAFNKVRRGLATSRTLRHVLGAARAPVIAERLVGAAPAAAGNAFLGMMLGVLPAVMLVFHLPIDIRHVTVSSGMVSVAAAALPPTRETLVLVGLAAAGTATVGVLNVASSFALALAVALRARPVRAPARELVAAVARQFRRHTRDFFLPPRE
ncbi:MAG: hypothetical protein IT374_01085 [Polyangiaceae bacterium]|nr:hypothetical protein [Polyangiaceae bacterium]